MCFMGFGFELQILCFLLSIDSSRGRLRNQVVSFLIWLWWVIDLAMFEFKFGTVRLFYLYLLIVWRITFACLVVYKWQVRYDVQRWGSCRSMRPGADDREWSHMSDTRWPGDREVGWYRIRSAPCTWRRGAHISWLSLKTKVDGLWVVWRQNH
jgi:hypothetical protein